MEPSSARKGVGASGSFKLPKEQKKPAKKPAKKPPKSLLSRAENRCLNQRNLPLQRKFRQRNQLRPRKRLLIRKFLLEKICHPRNLRPRSLQSRSPRKQSQEQTRRKLRRSLAQRKKLKSRPQPRKLR